MKKCINCVWEGTPEPGPKEMFCPACGDYLIDKEIKTEKPSKEKEVSFDLNNDGKVDKKDVTIAAKVLRNVRPRKKK